MNICSFLYTFLNQGNIPSFIELLESLLAHIPYQLHIKQESYYHSLFQLLVTILSQDAQSEISTDKGRIDLVIKVNAYIYIFEFKLDGSPEKALEQIEEKKYYEKYLLEKKKIFLIGVSFNRPKDQLQLEYQVKEL